jgi:hypothetical protein
VLASGVEYVERIWVASVVIEGEEDDDGIVTAVARQTIDGGVVVKE